MKRSVEQFDVEVKESPKKVSTPVQEQGIPIGRVDDPAERQADLMAERAITLAGDYGGPAVVHRSAGGSAPEGLQVDPGSLQVAARNGTSLDPSVRRRIEPGLGADLGSVRVHTGAAAGELAAGMGAAAFTHGNDVYFGAGQYRPGTPEGDRVIAHEAAHTVQNRSAGVQRFPASALTGAQPWQNLTGSVFRPGEGVSGGVYILSPKVPGDLKKVVVKPVFPMNNALEKESGAQLALADKIIKNVFGVAAPTSRVVKSGTPEFAQLLAVCQPHQPARPPKPVNEDDDAGNEAYNSWKSIADVESFMVMSEVANGTSVAGLIGKVGKDPNAVLDLARTVFSKDFLSDLGKLGVADLLLGNKDRMMFGGANLGNVMVSMQNGTGKLHAIDTSAVLPKMAKPSDLFATGNGTGSFTAKTNEEMSKEAGQHLDRFFAVVFSQMKSAPKPEDPNVLPEWQRMETHYKAFRERYVGFFKSGWDMAMLDVALLAMSRGEGPGGTKEMAEEHDSEHSSNDNLIANAGYLADRDSGASHAEAAKANAGMLVKGYVNSLDKTRMAPPTGDALDPRVLQPMSTTDLAVAAPVHPAVLPPLKDVKSSIVLGNIATVPSTAYATFDTMANAVVRGHAEIDRSVAMTVKGKRSVPLVGKKKQVANKDNEASHYATNVLAVSTGAARLAAATTYIFLIAKEADQWNFPMTPDAANAASSLLTYVNYAANTHRSMIATYKSRLDQATTGVAALAGHPQQTAVAGIVTQATSAMDKRVQALDSIAKLKLEDRIKSLASQ